jgi:hypothetical protein
MNLDFPIKECMNAKGAPTDLDLALTYGLVAAPGITDLIDFTLPP